MQAPDMALYFVKLGLAHCGRGPLQEKLGKTALTLGLQTGDYDTAYHALVHMPPTYGCLPSWLRSLCRVHSPPLLCSQLG